MKIVRPDDGGVRSRAFTTVPTRDGRVRFPTAESLGGLSLWQKMRYLVSRTVYLIGIATTIMIVFALVALCVCWCCEDSGENGADELLRMAREDQAREVAQNRKIELQALEQKKKEKEARAVQEERALMERRRREIEVQRRKNEERRAKEAAEKLAADAKARAEAEIKRRIEEERRKRASDASARKIELVAVKPVDETPDEFLDAEVRKLKIDKSTLTNEGAIVAMSIDGSLIRETKICYSKRVKKDPMRGTNRVFYRMEDVDAGTSPWMIYRISGKDFWVGKEILCKLFADRTAADFSEICFGGKNEAYRAWCTFVCTETPIYSVEWNEECRRFSFFTNQNRIEEARLLEEINRPRRARYEQKIERMRARARQLPMEIENCTRDIEQLKLAIEKLKCRTKHEKYVGRQKYYDAKMDSAIDDYEVANILKKLNIPKPKSRENRKSAIVEIMAALNKAEVMKRRLEEECEKRKKEPAWDDEMVKTLQGMTFKVYVVESLPRGMKLGLNFQSLDLQGDNE